jgi:23S rRNA pseudouridine1911/1915/1917 synthase
MSESFIITEEEAGERIDKILPVRYPEQSRSYFHRLINDHALYVNGESVKKKYQGVTGDEVTFSFCLTPEISLKPEAMDLDILFEDEWIIGINKPRGLVVHPGSGNWTGTLANGLVHYCEQLQAITTTPLRPGIVHRLDKDTSGVMITAKTESAMNKLSKLFADRQVQKVYLAVTVGSPGDGAITEPIGRHPKERMKMAIREEGRAATTNYRTLSKGEKLAFVELTPLTGRTHQLRVHMKHLGKPILGDPVYGSSHVNKHFKVSKQMLHASSLELVHPFTGELLRLEAPLPSDMQPFIKNQ